MLLLKTQKTKVVYYYAVNKSRLASQDFKIRRQEKPLHSDNPNASTRDTCIEDVFYFLNE